MVYHRNNSNPGIQNIYIYIKKVNIKFNLRLRTLWNRIYRSVLITNVKELFLSIEALAELFEMILRSIAKT